MSILEVKHIYKSFHHTEVLKDISFSLEKGQAVSVIGSSGSGKTTLLRCLNFLETPDKGVIRVNEEILFDAEDPETKLESAIRKKRLHFGLVFQSFNLFPTLNILENVMYPMEIRKKPAREAKKRGKELLGAVGLGDVSPKKLPAMLSGGQQQRVAIARALASDAKIILADEPTGNLDTENGKIVIDLL